MLTPDVALTTLEVRGFHRESAAAQQLLETVGRSFLTGLARASAARDTTDIEAPLEELPTTFKGFAYEGAAMGFALADVLPLGGGSGRMPRFLAGRGDRHVYMAYVGVGWAMARLPRLFWSRLHAPDPLLRWLVLDGYGFHQAYFHTQRYVHQQERRDRFPWPAQGPAWYADRAIDQGIGRALWFVGGTSVDVVAGLVEKFPAQRRPDLYAGVGLAASYAGGGDETQLRALLERAGEYRANVAQGCVFAVSARTRAGLVVEHTGLAARVLCGMDVPQASQLADDTRPTGPVSGPEPAYEVWRRRVMNEFAATGPGRALAQP